ncbi:MAG: AbrB/MazE/SpoVT family DNA-binding domain-containing protein [Actinomycetota bacterium]
MTEIKNVNGNVVKKRISVSPKRQITIPIEFFNQLGIEKEVYCYIQNNAIAIRPVNEAAGDFDEQILADLISQGFSGNELLTRFKDMRHSIRPAAESLLEEAYLAAEGKAPFNTYQDVFGKKGK